MASHTPALSRRFPLLALTVLGAVAASPVKAGDAERGANPDFRSLDANHDAQIDVKEAAAHPELQSQYQAVDIDQDGLISEQEFVGAFPAPAGQPTESWFTAPEHKPE